MRKIFGESFHSAPPPRLRLIIIPLISIFLPREKQLPARSKPLQRNVEANIATRYYANGSNDRGQITMRGKKSIIYRTKSETLNVIERRSTFAIAITQSKRGMEG